jgi:hypothetical protein
VQLIIYARIKHITGASVTNVVEKGKRKNLSNRHGKKVDTRKKPHVTYVVLKVCSILKLQYFT